MATLSNIEISYLAGESRFALILEGTTVTARAAKSIRGAARITARKTGAAVIWTPMAREMARSQGLRVTA